MLQFEREQRLLALAAPHGHDQKGHTFNEFFSDYFRSFEQYFGNNRLHQSRAEKAVDISSHDSTSRVGHFSVERACDPKMAE